MMAAMQRRTFLGAISVAAQAAPGGIPIAFLGGTHSHAFEKAKVALASPDWDLRGVWEPNADVAAKYKAAGVASLDRDAILRDPSIRVVAVESDVIDHQEHATLALEAGKHVHVEKPPAHTMPGLRKVIELARSKKLLLQSGYMWRYNDAVAKTVEAAKQGWLGDVYLIRASMNTLVVGERRKEWAVFAGGDMFEQGAHCIDFVCQLLGRPEKVTHFLRKDNRQFQDTLKDNTAAVFEYPHAMAIVHATVMQPGAGPYRTFEVLGTNGTATIRPIEPPALEIDLAKDAGPYKKGRQKVDCPPYKRYVADLAELAAAVRGERKLTVDLDGEFTSCETLLRASGQA